MGRTIRGGRKKDHKKAKRERLKRQKRRGSDERKSSE